MPSIEFDSNSIEPWHSIDIESTAWVDKHLHFGNVATLRQVADGIEEVGETNTAVRAEGIHSLIKAHIKKSTLDLFDVRQAMRPAITN